MDGCILQLLREPLFFKKEKTIAKSQQKKWNSKKKKKSNKKKVWDKEPKTERMSRKKYRPKPKNINNYIKF